MRNNIISAFGAFLCISALAYLNSIDEGNLWQGTRHVFPNPVSKYELLRHVNDVFSLRKNLQEKISEDTCDRTLSSIHEQSFAVKSIEEQIEDLKSSCL